MGLLNRIIVSLLPIVPRFIVWRVARRYVAGAERAATCPGFWHVDDRGVAFARGALIAQPPIAGSVRAG